MSFSQVTKDAIWDRDNKSTKAICPYCKIREIHINTAHYDHMISSKNGGTNDISNGKAVCAQCNYDKGSMNLDEFMKKFYPTEIQKKEKIMEEILILIKEKEKEIKILKEKYTITKIEIEKSLKKESKELPNTKLESEKIGKAKNPIIGFIYKNKEIKTYIMKEALKMVCDDLASTHLDFSEKVKLLKYFSEDEKKFPTLAYKIKGTNLYVKTNLCASDVEKQTREILSLFGYSQDILKINYR